MDTKLKKFKTGKANKIICALTAIMLVASFVYSFLPCYFYYYYIGLEKSLLLNSDEIKITDHYYFAPTVASDVDTILTVVNKGDYDALYVSEKERVIDLAITEFEQLKSVEDYYYENENDKVYYCEFYGDYDFAGAGFVTLNASYNLSTDEARVIFESQIDDSYANHAYRQYIYDATVGEYVNFHYYAVNDNGKVITNVENPDEFLATLYDKEYIAIEYDSFDASDDIYNNNLISMPTINNSKVYVTIDMYALSDGDHYGEMAKVIAGLQGYNFHICALVCGVSLLLLIALFVYALTCLGKTTKLDKLFNDIRLVVFGGCEVGLGLCSVIAVEAFQERSYVNVSPYSIVNKIIYSDALTFITIAIACLFCFILYGFVASLMRQGKNGINPLKNTLIYKLGELIAKGVNKIISLIKSVVGYKVGNFNKLVVLWIVLYAVINIGLVIAQLAWAGWDVWLLAFLTMFFQIVLNVVCVVFVVWYIRNLDIIITAMHNRTTPDVDYAKLPNSLKILVDNMQYTQDELNKAVNRAVKDERLRTELITNVSHDLKTPLTSIINYVDLLSKCDIQGEQEREYISVLTDKSQKLKRLVDDLVEASKITSGVVSINPVYLNLNELVMQAVVDTQKDFDARQLTLVIKNENDSITAFADGNKTHRIVDNLLTNAKKYSAPHSRVYIDMYYENEYAVFEIKNISAQPLDISADELTERFVRGDKSRSQDGNGLGLSIAKNLCAAQHGDLKLTIDGDLFKAKVYLPKK